MDGSMVSVEGRRRRARFASDEVELLLVVLDLVFMIEFMISCVYNN